MPHHLKNKFVVAIASSALFDLKESDHVFRTEGSEKYRAYQRENEENILQKGVAFPLIEKLLQFKTIEGEPLVEVILFSRNDPDTGLRVFKSIEHYGLNISRAIFTTGRNPFQYMKAFEATLFLSGNKEDVREAIDHGLPAGHVLTEKQFNFDNDDDELRIAFDFDGVLADDSSETIFKEGNIETFFEHETKFAHESLGEGPLYTFLQGISRIQKEELKKVAENNTYKPKIRIALCTARNAPALHRVVTTLRKWDVKIDEAFFLGGIDKSSVLNVYEPHMFFDDQIVHIKSVSDTFPSVHIPYGIANKNQKKRNEQ